LLLGVAAGLTVAVAALIANLVVASLLAFLFNAALETLTGLASGAYGAVAVGFMIVGEYWFLLWTRQPDGDPASRVMNSTLLFLSPIYLLLPFGYALYVLLFDLPTS
jgi:predicted small integral membrane protein